jgi:O-antigen ligase
MTDQYRFESAQNLYVELIAETGIIGLLTFCAMVIVTVREGLRTFRETNNRYFKATSLGLVSAFAGYLVILISADFIYILPFMWVLMGLIVAQRRLHHKHEAVAARSIRDY